MTRKSAAKTPKATAKQADNTQLPTSLNVKQRAFLMEYLKDKNATQAAIRAGYSAKTAYAIGHKLLKNAEIADAIQQKEGETLLKVQQETGITLARTLKEIARAAFFDPRKFFDEEGNLVPIVNLDDDTAAALAGFEVTEEFDGSGRARKLIGFTKKIKMADRKGYLDMLMKHLGGYKADNEQQKPENAVGELVALIQAQGSRLPLAK